MADTMEFATADVLSVITGRLMAPIGSVYRVLNWMTRENLFTHQLPRVSREAVPIVLAMHPMLQQAIDEAEQVTQENFAEWRKTWEDRYGPKIAVPRFSRETHERIDPTSELAEMVHPDRIIEIK